MAFDIDSLDIADSAKWHVTNAAGKPQYYDHPTEKDGNGIPVQVPLTITIHSPGTKKAAQAQFDYAKKRQERTMKQVGGGTVIWTEADERRERAAFLSEITISLDGFEVRGGAPALYADIKKPHIADGVQKTFNDLGNFNREFSPTSSSTPGLQLG